MGSPFDPVVVEQAEVVPRITLSGPLKVDLQLYRGDTGRFRITVTDPDGLPIDLTGATWDADIRLTANATDVVSQFDVIPVAGDNSSVDVVLDADNAELIQSACVYDVEMRKGTTVTTLIFGAITVTADVSRP